MAVGEGGTGVERLHVYMYIIIYYIYAYCIMHIHESTCIYDYYIDC